MFSNSNSIKMQWMRNHIFAFEGWHIKKPQLLLISQIFSYLANELWTVRIVSQLLNESPFIFASNDWQNSLNSVNVDPKLRSGCLQLNRILSIACVAHALLITCIRKKNQCILWTPKNTLLQYYTNLSGKENFFQAAILHNRSCRFIILNPFKQKY